jgi:hypothetical protein
MQRLRSPAVIRSKSADIIAPMLNMLPKELRRLVNEQLSPGEEVRWLCRAASNWNAPSLTYIITNQRVLVVSGDKVCQYSRRDIQFRIKHVRANGSGWLDFARKFCLVDGVGNAAGASPRWLPCAVGFGDLSDVAAAEIALEQLLLYDERAAAQPPLSTVSLPEDVPQASIPDTLPPRLKTAVETEIRADEVLYWLGQPDCLRLHPYLRLKHFALIYGGVLAVALFLWMQPSIEPDPLSAPILVTLLMGTVYCCMAVLMGRSSRSKLKRTIYIITNQRVLELYVTGNWRIVKSFLPRDIFHGEPELRRNGLWDIVFALETFRDGKDREEIERVGFRGLQEATTALQALVRLKEGP